MSIKMKRHNKGIKQTATIERTSVQTMQIHRFTKLDRQGGRCGTVIYQKNTQTSNYLQSSAHNVMSAINIHISSGVSQPCSQNYQNLFSIISTHFLPRSLKRLRFCSKSGNDFQKIQQRFLFTVLKPFPASKMDSKNSQHLIF